MRIGLLTLPFNNNYGGYLQAMALTTVLEEMGHEVILINRRHPDNANLKDRVKFTLKTIVKKFLGKDTQLSIHNQKIYAYEKQGAKMLPLVRSVIKNISEPIFRQDDFKCLEKLGIEAYIVGSDQIWRPKYVPHVQNFFLDFLPGDIHVKRIAYAASFGTDDDEYTLSQKNECGILISKFDAVSVREDSGLELVSRFGWNSKNIMWVLDPTLLLSASFYAKWTEDDNVQNNYHYIASYILDEGNEKKLIEEKAQEEIHLPIYKIGTIHNGVKASISSWLSGIKNADFVITDSFHGMVFSIIFHVPFVVLVNKGRGGTRFLSLLNRYGLNDRIVSTVESLNGLFHSTIDWYNVVRILQEDQDKSFSFLKTSLSEI